MRKIRRRLREKLSPLTPFYLLLQPMDHLLQHIQSRLVQRKLYRQTLAQVIKKKLQPKAIAPELLRVHLEGQHCLVFLGAQEDMTGWFLQKQQLISEINQKIAQEGRNIVVEDMRFQKA